jgi:hypothetical protein
VNVILLAKKLLAAEVVKRVLGVARALELDEAEAGHDAAVDDAAEAVEELVHVVRARVGWEATKVKTTSHGVVSGVVEGEEEEEAQRTSTRWRT